MISPGVTTALLVIGPVLVGIGIPLGMSFSFIYSSMVHQQLQLGPGSLSFQQWDDTPVPVYMEIYMWNWTNAIEFSQNYSIVPKFEEIGPFVFKLTTKRAFVQWNDNHTVSFAPNRTYVYQPDLSVDLNVEITTLSPVPAVLAYYGRLWSSPFFLALIDRLVEIYEELFKTATAGQWIFYGIEDDLLDLIVPMKEIADLPLPFDHFAWFYGRNASASAEGTFTIFTGVDDLSKVGQIDRWQGQNHSNAYSGVCGNIGGTTGELISPMKTPPETLGVFAADVCSQIALDYAGETTEAGVDGWLFKGTERALDDGKIFPETSCFCTGECIPQGTRNISECKFGAPAFVSYPHYYLASDIYTANIEGMKPNPEEHEFFLKVEPTVGIPLSVRAQLQINLRIDSTDSMNLYKGLPEMFVPVLWFREKASITPELANLLNILLVLPTVGPAVLYALGALGLILFGVGIYFELRMNRISLSPTHET